MIVTHLTEMIRRQSSELVRERLAAQISAELAPDGCLGVLVLSPDIEQTISASIQRIEHGTLITLDPSTIAKIVGSIREAVEGVSVQHPDPVILCSPESPPIYAACWNASSLAVRSLLRMNSHPMFRWSHSGSSALPSSTRDDRSCR